MGSRWFRIAFGSMVLFSMFLMCRYASQDVNKVDRDLSASELYSAFQQDFDAAEDMYCGNFITVEGTVQEIRGGDFPTSLILGVTGGEGQVECLLRNKRNYKRSEFYESQPVSLNGWLDDDQEPGKITVKNCRILFF